MLTCFLMKALSAFAMLFKIGICAHAISFKSVVCLPINHYKKRKFIKEHADRTLSFHPKPQSYEKKLMSDIDIIFFMHKLS